MELERISVTLRDREPWEAVDLGHAMIRQWARPVWASWLAVALPVAVFLGTTLHDAPWLAAFIFWWVKPLMDRVPLAIISRAAFGEVLAPSKLLRNLPSYLGSGLAASITVRRLSPWRSFLLPVDQLEKLRGADRARRVSSLCQNHLGHASALTVLGVVFELSLLTAIFFLVVEILPGELVGENEVDSLIETLFTDSYLSTLYLGAVILLEPFYVAGGFGLYMQRRIELEAWDIELGLRRMATRLRSGKKPTARALWLLAFSLLCARGARAAPPSADVDPETDPRRTVERILEHPQFGTTEIKEKWQPIVQREQQHLQTDWKGLQRIAAALARLLVWGGSAFAVLFLIYLLHRYFTLSPRGERGTKKRMSSLPTVLFGLDVRAESLPKDPVGEARREWEHGNPTAALSLLYRASLAHLVGRLRIDIPRSATEGDCVALLAPRSEPVLHEDFIDLTAAWQRVAYAHRPPADEQFENLCQRWAERLRGDA